MPHRMQRSVPSVIGQRSGLDEQLRRTHLAAKTITMSAGAYQTPATVAAADMLRGKAHLAPAANNNGVGRQLLAVAAPVLSLTV